MAFETKAKRRRRARATTGKRMWTRIVMPNRRPHGIDQAKGSCIVATHLLRGKRCTPDGLILSSPQDLRNRLDVPRAGRGGTSSSPSGPGRGSMTRNILHVGRKIKVALDTDVLPDGQTVTRDVVLHPGAVAILPLVDAGHVCLLRNYRTAVSATLWEVP